MAMRFEDSARLANVPLAGERPEKSITENAIDKTFASAANLIKLLPTTTVLAFQILSPILTNGGHCYSVNKYLTGFLLGLSGISCFIDSFTDSYKAEDGTLYYGIATRSGLWTMNTEINKTVDLSSYKLTFLDFVHAVLSVLVFASVALMDPNVVNCYYADAREDQKQLIISLPIAVGTVCSMVFVTFPTKRHGIGYPAAD